MNVGKLLEAASLYGKRKELGEYGKILYGSCNSFS